VEESRRTIAQPKFPTIPTILLPRPSNRNERWKTPDHDEIEPLMLKLESMAGGGIEPPTHFRLFFIGQKRSFPS